MININSIVGNIRNDENLTVKYRVMTENRLSEIVQISRTEIRAMMWLLRYPRMHISRTEMYYC